MLMKMLKICILVFVILPAVWVTATATAPAPAPAAATTTAATTSEATTTTGTTITNDLHSSHAPTLVSQPAEDAVERNESATKTKAEIQQTKFAVTSATLRDIVGGSIAGPTTTSSSTTTSTATPTTTATTSTTTTTTTIVEAAKATATAASTANGNAAGNGDEAATAAAAAAAAATATPTATTTAMPETAATATITSTAAPTTSEALTTISDQLMTTSVPPLALLGSVFDRLYRIKLSEEQQQPQQSQQQQQQEEEEDAQYAMDGSTISPLQIQMQAAASYQVAETLADLNEEERARYGAILAQQPTASKLNIVDLYPMKLDDFQPIIQSDNEQLLQQHTVFTQLDNAEDYRQNLMPNEVEMHAVAADSRVVVNQVTTTAAPAPTTTTTTTTTTTMLPLVTSSGVETTPSDFTGKLLAEQDDLITEIERKFQLHETTSTVMPSTRTNRVKMELPRLAAGDSYIDRRVKKSFEFPMQHRASDAMALPHVDFGNTKFNTDAIDNHESRAGSLTATGGVASGASHPEFSTTKFYNSKELYNEMLLHNKRKLMKESGTEPTADSIIKSSTESSEQQQQRQVIKASDTTKLETSSSTRSPMSMSMAATRRVTLMPTEQSSDGVVTTTAAGVAVTATTTIAAPAPATTTAAGAASTTGKPMKYQKELKRAKLLLKALTPPQQLEKLEVVAAKVKITASASGSGSSTVVATATTNSPSELDRPGEHMVANLAKSSLKPIARPRILSRLQEKINSLECELQNVPQDSHLWRGNETHELLLPIVTTEHCKPDEHCIPNVLTWEGEAEIQSGDILIVEINDAMLTTGSKENQTSNYSQSVAHAAQVYQVTRSGHEHCDVTEGVLLDITPLVVDGRKLVTLYDKDLTEGVNLLIVVSELWGTQCVRLKVTTKTDNCGENADCSGKGVCYSNGAMEEYECQCCSGFAGPHCEEIDACNPSPCTNNGICVDLSQGHEGNSYQCLCPYGYAGKNCQYESDPCNPAECMNGGSCVGNSTHFRCDCTPGFTGPLCQHSLNECESSPCVHGICVDQEDGFRCFCQPGFAGELCNFEYNECESNPCQNSGECIDHIGSYECRCTKGYSGSRCQIKVDFCANKPCPEGHRCIDHGNDFSCECPGGRNGPDCNQMPRTYFQQCSVNPCTHGGTCWSSGDSFYCACRPGYTGTMCEDEFVVETVVSSSEFIVDDANARNFNDKTFGSSVVLKSPIELHNAYFAAGVLAAAIFIVAVVVTICHCKVNQTYRKFSTRSTSFIPILGFSRRPKTQGKLNKHWLSGKGLNAPGAAASAAATAAGVGAASAAQAQRESGNEVGTNAPQLTRHLPCKPHGNSSQMQSTLGGQLQERPFQRHLAMNLENDMYYTVDFSENSQHSPLIQ